jgi:hypothetical protein
LYLLDDGSVIWLLVGRKVPLKWLQSVMVGIRDETMDKGEFIKGDIPLEDRPKMIAFRTREREGGELVEGSGIAVGEKIERVVRILREMSAYKQELRVLWAENFNGPGKG